MKTPITANTMTVRRRRPDHGRPDGLLVVADPVFKH